MKCMLPADRKALGKRGQTMLEAIQNATIKGEKDIQKQIANLLTLRGVPFINPPMHKRSMLPKGWPDFTFAYRGNPLGIEAKVLGGEPRPDQVKTLQAMADNGWQVHVVTSLAEVQTILRVIDSTHNIEG